MAGQILINYKKINTVKIKYFISILILLLIIISCGNTKKSSQNDDTSKSQITKTIKGSGAETQRITLNKGAAIFKYNYSGSDNFIIWLKTSDAKNLDLIVNEIKSTSGSKSVSIPKDGTYILDVETVGNWTIDIK